MIRRREWALAWALVVVVYACVSTAVWMAVH